MKFENGMLVRSIDDSHKQFTPGKEYLVDSVIQEDLQYLRLKGNNGLTYVRLASRFESVVAVAPKKPDDIWFVVDVINTNLPAAGTKLVNPTRKPGAILVGGKWYKESRFSKEQQFPEWKLLLNKLLEKTKLGSGVCSYAMVDTEGNERFQVRDICHARLTSQYERKFYRTAVLEVKGHYKEHKHPEAFKAYVDYVINRSPWKGAFITRTTDEVISSGIALDVNKGVNYVVSAAVALRIGHEYMHLAKDFFELSSSGCPEHLAFLTASMCNGYHCKGQYELGGQNGAHHILSSGMSLDNLKAFFFKGEANMGDAFNKSQRYKILGLIGEFEQKNTVWEYLSKYPHVSVVKGMWDKTKAIVPHPQYGLIPMAFYLAERFNGN